MELRKLSENAKNDEKSKQKPKEKEIPDFDELQKKTEEEAELATIVVGDTSVTVSKPKRMPFVKKKYKGRETISASIPGWLKAAMDYLAATSPKYRGFGGKSKFLSEAIEQKLKDEFPELYEKLKKLKYESY